MTHLEIINRVLLRLREDTVTASTSTDYSRLISAIVVDAYEEVLDEHDWEACVSPLEVTLVAGKSEYLMHLKDAEGGDVTDASFRALSPDAELQFDSNNCAEAKVFDDSADDSGQYIQFVPPEDFRTMRDMDRDQTNEYPQWFTLNRYSSDADAEKLVLSVYPEPSVTRTLKVHFWNPPPEWKTDGTTDASPCWIPDRPVYALALMYAYNERGEEIGEPGNLAEQRYLTALQVAKEKDITPYNRANRYDWVRG